MNAHHVSAFPVDACAKCGISHMQVMNGASRWCDYLDHEPSGNPWWMWAHAIAILFLVIAPIYGMMPPGPLSGIFCSALAILIGLGVAQIHAGWWDWLGIALTESAPMRPSGWDDDVRRALNDGWS